MPRASAKSTQYLLPLPCCTSQPANSQLLTFLLIKLLGRRSIIVFMMVALMVGVLVCLGAFDYERSIVECTLLCI